MSYFNKVDINSALPTGANTIGNVGLNAGGAEIGSVKPAFKSQGSLFVPPTSLSDYTGWANNSNPGSLTLSCASGPYPITVLVSGLASGGVLATTTVTLTSSSAVSFTLACTAVIGIQLYSIAGVLNFSALPGNDIILRASGQEITRITQGSFESGYLVFQNTANIDVVIHAVSGNVFKVVNAGSTLGRSMPLKTGGFLIPAGYVKEERIPANSYLIIGTDLTGASVQIEAQV
jgi:hypothetical protein